MKKTEQRRCDINVTAQRKENKSDLPRKEETDIKTKRQNIKTNKRITIFYPHNI